ncbi:MAG: hypothetical protein LBB75_10220 [Oscillospiraceae bacterium]|jgi:hypothetical protein|nr:hypothetical protein [Oscillospiraceae bacterium]
MPATQDKEILRALAGEYMSYAALPVQKEKIALWRALNRGEMARPMVTIDQLPWDELACEELACRVEDPFWRGVERDLRRTLYKWRHFPVDMVLDPFIAVPKAVRRAGYGMEVKEIMLGPEESTCKSHRYINQLLEMEDVGRITDDRITHDQARTETRQAEAEGIFAGVAPVRMAGIGFHLGVWDRISMYMGVEECYFAFYDRPELLHAAMERLTRATIRGIEDANALGVHDDSANLCHCSHIFTDELLPGSGAGRGPVSQNCWCLGLAQLMTVVSPAIFEEFELPYITRMAKYFGGIYYGCCDRLDDRLELVRRIPNVRKVSCSPWSDRARFAAGIGPELVMSAKPSPAFLATGSFDEGAVRRDLEATCKLARQNNANLEFLLKDVSTVKNDPSRLTRWARAAMRAVGG